MPTLTSPIVTDAVVIGAGPVGLFQAFELGLLGINCHIVDSLAAAGGQCRELYPDKPIYDIPGIKKISGRELINNLLEQLEPFKPQFHFNQQVTAIKTNDDGSFSVATAADKQFLTKTVFIAAGVGVFQPQPLRLKGIEKFNERQIFYSVKNCQQFQQQHVVILGGGDSAVDWALELTTNNPAIKSITLIHRRDVFTATPVKVKQLRQLAAQKKLQLLIGQTTNFHETATRLTALDILTVDGTTIQIPCDVLLVFFGMSPKLGPIAEWGVELQRKQVIVNTADFSTSIKGIFAVGDINSYPGKKKLILCGFHEATLAAYAASAIINPTNPAVLQYTTTNTKVQQLLNVR